MKKQNIILLGITGVIVAALLLDHFGIVPIRQIAQLNNKTVTAAAGKNQTGPEDGMQQSDSQAGPEVNTVQAPIALQQDYIGKLVANITLDQRKALLDDSEAFRNFVNQEATNLSLLQAAKANNLQSDPDIQFLVERSGDNVLREIYITRLINSKIAADFPNEQQIQEYFDNNKDRLKVGERLSVWQIFLPVTDAMDDAAIAAIAKEANRIANEIKSDKLDFSAAALQFSRHDPSRLNGGFMGMIKVSELIPEIRKALDELEIGQVSTGIKSPMGYHILKKGESMPEQDLTVDQIRNEIKNLMLNQARVQLRNAINDQVLKTYPVTIDATLIEQWRQGLLTESQ